MSHKIKSTEGTFSLRRAVSSVLSEADQAGTCHIDALEKYFDSIISKLREMQERGLKVSVTQSDTAGGIAYCSYREATPTELNSKLNGALKQYGLTREEAKKLLDKFE